MEDHRMSDFFTTNNSIMLQKSMDFLWTKQRVILDNISNVETPNYKAEYVTFEDAFKAQIQAAAQQDKPLSSMRNVLQSARSTIHTDSTESARMDGNNVNISEQQIELVRNAYQIQYVLDAINGGFTTMRTVIRG